MIISDLIIHDKQVVQLDEIFMSAENHQYLLQLIKEYRHITTLLQYGLPVNNKLLLHGASGCGKTTTAKAIANALGKPLLILNLSNIVSARIGETAQNIRQVFEKAARTSSVLFLDEFDLVGKARESDDREVGEMRRLVNTLIQLIDYYPDTSLLLAATNHKRVIDHALLRRFQVTLPFCKPTNEQLNQYYDRLIADFPKELTNIQRIYGISYAEARDQAFTQIKARLIANLEQDEVTE